VLVSTATERVVNDVHCDTTDARPVGCGIRHLMVLVPCFDKRLVNAAATSYNADGCPAAVIKPFGLATRHPDTDTVFNFVYDNCLDS
jgi:hypothetical protein